MKKLLIIFILAQVILSNELNTKADKLYNNISLLKKARQYKKTYKKFFEVSKKVVQTEPSNHKAQSFLGHYYMTQQRSLSLAKFHFAKALQYNSSNPQYGYMLGIIYGIEGDFLNAKKYFEVALTIDKNSKVFNDLFASTKDLDNGRLKSIKNYNRAIELDIDYKSKEMAYFLIGKIHLDNVQNQEAIKSFENMLNIYPKSIYGLNGLAMTYTRDMQYDRAKETYQKLIKYHPDIAIGYLGVFEIKLILNIDFDDSKVNFYIREFSQDTINIARYELINILKSALQDKNYKSEYDRWKNYYHNLDILRNWSLDEVISWTYTLDDEDKRERLLDILIDFKDDDKQL